MFPVTATHYLVKYYLCSAQEPLAPPWTANALVYSHNLHLLTPSNAHQNLSYGVVGWTDKDLKKKIRGRSVKIRGKKANLILFHQLFCF